MMPITVLVMAYGGPDSLDDVAPYLLDVRGGRETPEHIVEEVRARYAAIGGRSPILEQTNAQAAALGEALAARSSSGAFDVVVGMRHWSPWIRDVLDTCRAAGTTRVVGVVMAPHYSRMSIGAYERVARDAAGNIELVMVERWGTLPGFLDTIESRVRDALARFPADRRADVRVLFTAHSLPERILTWNDPYRDELDETVGQLSRRLGPQHCGFAFQSAAMTAEPWLGPDAGAVLDEWAEEGVADVVIAPIGFVTEHVEILYDIDIELAHRAKERGIRLERIEMAGSAPAMMDGLAALIIDSARARGWV